MAHASRSTIKSAAALPSLPGQIFVFGTITLFPDSTSHLGQVKNFSLGRIVRFGNLEYAADSCGELVFLTWVSDQIEEHNDVPAQTSESVLAREDGTTHTSDLALSHDPSTTSDD